MSAGRKLSGTARAKLGALEAIRLKWDHVRALVEQATGRQSGTFQMGQDAGGELQRLTGQISRAAHETSRLAADHAFSALAEDMRELPALARRGAAIRRPALLRMREVVANVYAGLDLVEKKLREGPPEETA